MHESLCGESFLELRHEAMSLNSVATWTAVACNPADRVDKIFLSGILRRVVLAELMPRSAARNALGVSA